MSTLAFRNQWMPPFAVVTDRKSVSKDAQSAPQEVQKPYSVFTQNDKWLIVAVSSLAALFRRVCSPYWIIAVLNQSIAHLRLIYTSPPSPLLRVPSTGPQKTST